MAASIWATSLPSAAFITFHPKALHLALLALVGGRNIVDRADGSAVYLELVIVEERLSRQAR
jgi:hypothetical protein